jgi:hypothetical protein
MKHLLHILFLGLVGWLPVGTALPAQSSCPDFGGHPLAGNVVPAPFALVCGPVAAPAWRLYVPPHRAPGAKPGFAPDDARALPCVLVTYRCTGWWWLPHAPARLRTMGYVLDQPDRACALSP